MSIVLNGKALALKREAELARRAGEVAARGRTPTLAVILAGDDPASAVYVRNKVRACARTGIRSIEKRLPRTVSEEELLSLIDALNADPNVDGILVQLPLPAELACATERITTRILPEKDVDGFHTVSAGALMTGRPGLRPCTPAGVMEILRAAEIDPAGQRALVIGRSNIVGKPMALLLLAADATVTIAHSRTPDLAVLCREADIVVAAVGRPGTVTADMVKPGAVLLDVGINRLPDGTLAGDISPEAYELASAYTPVPGGVGPMTISMLLENTLRAAEARR